MGPDDDRVRAAGLEARQRARRDAGTDDRGCAVAAAEGPLPADSIAAFTFSTSVEVSVIPAMFTETLIRLSSENPASPSSPQR